MEAQLMEYPIERLRTLARENGIKGKQVLMMSKLQLTKAIIDAGYTGNNEDPQPAPALETIEVPSVNVSGNGNGKQTVNPPPHVGGGLEALIAAAIAPYLDNAMAGKTDEARVAEIATDIVESALMKEDYVSYERAQGIVNDAIKGVISTLTEELTKINIPKTIIVENVATGTTVDVGLQHRLFPKVLDLARLRMNQMLVGPAGGGKSTVAKNVAKALGLQFRFISIGPLTTSTHFYGYMDGHGNYHGTAFRECFENGGVFLMDEIDAGLPGILTCVNEPLANGHAEFPDGIIAKHPDFICIAGANTFGRGADRLYVGRNQLDAATLDRFKVLDFDYDEELETALSGNEDWTKNVLKWRHRAWELKERVVISPRASIDGAKLLANGWKQEEVESLCVWKGVSPEIIRKIKGA